MMKRTNGYLLAGAVGVMLCIAFGLPPRAARAQSATYYSTPVYFPTAGPEPAGSGIPGVPAGGIAADGKMLSLASTGMNTLAGQFLTLGIGAPRDATYLLVSLFDADTSGDWDVASAPEDTLFALYADPNDSGHPSTASAVAGLNPVTSAPEPGPW